ncbi:MAG: hypothetical protein JJE04_08145 [Acidobacteriia bacterium]|nr:hypothetical protein [Terriglobia bacterium]
MSTDALIKVMTAAVVLSAVALVAQACLIFGIFKAMKAVRDQLNEFLPKAESFLAHTERTLEESRLQVQEVSLKANTVLDLTKKQLERVDEVLGEAANRAKVQLERVELVLDDTISRVHDTVVTLNNTILRPMRELNGLASGLKAALQFLLRGGRPTVAQATADEEMFI